MASISRLFPSLLVASCFAAGGFEDSILVQKHGDVESFGHGVDLKLSGGGGAEQLGAIQSFTSKLEAKDPNTLTEAEKNMVKDLITTLETEFETELEQQHIDDQGTYHAAMVQHNKCITNKDTYLVDSVEDFAGFTDSEEKHRLCRKLEYSLETYQSSADTVRQAVWSAMTGSAPAEHGNLCDQRITFEADLTNYKAKGVSTSCDVDQSQVENAYCSWLASKTSVCRALDECITAVDLVGSKTRMEKRIENRLAILHSIHKVKCRLQHIYNFFDANDPSSVNTTDSCENVAHPNKPAWEFPGWVKIASQDTTNGYSDWEGAKTLAKQERINFILNKNDPSNKNFFIVSALNAKDYLDNGVYKFRMVQHLTDGSKHEYEWTQTSWLTESTITEYKAIKEEACNAKTAARQRFRGMGFQSQEGANSILDGNGGASDWWNAIGVFSDYHSNKMPASCYQQVAADKYFGTGVELYVWKSLDIPKYKSCSADSNIESPTQPSLDDTADCKGWTDERYSGDKWKEHTPVTTCRITCPTQMHLCAGQVSGTSTMSVGGVPVHVQCRAGYVLFQQRLSGTDFYKNWAQYKSGFGDHTNFWLGNEKLHQLTKKGAKLRIELEDKDGNKGWGEWDNFHVASEPEGYMLTVSGYSGDIGDSLAYHNGKKFSTSDVDNDEYSGNCASNYHGAWWFDQCHKSNLNGNYGDDAYGMHSWYAWKGYYHSLPVTRMMVMPKA